MASGPTRMNGAARDPCNEYHGCDDKGQPEVELPSKHAQSWDATVSVGFERDRSSHSSGSVMQKERAWRKKRRRPLSMELSSRQEPRQNEVSSFCSPLPFWPSSTGTNKGNLIRKWKKRLKERRSKGRLFKE